MMNGWSANLLFHGFLRPWLEWWLSNGLAFCCWAYALVPFDRYGSSNLTIGGKQCLRLN